MFFIFGIGVLKMEEKNIETANTNQNAQEITAKIKCEACNREFAKPEDLAMHNSAKHNIPLNNAKQEESKSSSKTWLWILGIMVVLFVGYFLVNGNLTGNAVSGNSGDVQRITLRFSNNYAPNTITVEAGKPVEIILDSSVRGCYRSFNIRALGVSYSSSSPSDTIKFTPTQKGSFEFACGMRMGRGTINVV